MFVNSFPPQHTSFKLLSKECCVSLITLFCYWFFFLSLFPFTTDVLAQIYEAQVQTASHKNNTISYQNEAIEEEGKVNAQIFTSFVVPACCLVLKCHITSLTLLFLNVDQNWWGLTLRKRECRERESTRLWLLLNLKTLLKKNFWIA